MATIEALDELYAMGFLVEEEYLSRRAALGFGPPEKTNNNDTSGYSLDPAPTGNTYNQNNSDNQFYTGYNQPDYNNTTVIDTPETNTFGLQNETYGIDNLTISNPYSFDNQTNGNQITDHQTTDNSTILETHNTTESYSTPGYPNPISLTDLEDTPSAPIEMDVTMPNLHIEPVKPDDYNEQFDFNPGPREVIVVCRSKGAYMKLRRELPISRFDIQKYFGFDGTLHLAGGHTTQQATEYYWTQTQFIPSPAVETCEGGKVYVWKEETEQRRRNWWSSPVDERVLYAFLRTTLEKTVLSKGAEEPHPFTREDRKIRNYRDFSGEPCCFDPRLVVEHLARYAKVEKYPATGPTRSITKLKTLPTPEFMVLPAFMNALKAVGSKARYNYAEIVPKDAKEILAKLAQCIETNTCYFSGEPAYPGSFLKQSLHSDTIVELYRQALDSVSKSSSNYDQYSVESIGRSTHSNETENGERYSYTNAIPISYGWPTHSELDIRSTFCPAISRKVAGGTSRTISSLVEELIQLRGPAAGTKQV